MTDLANNFDDTSLTGAAVSPPPVVNTVTTASASTTLNYDLSTTKSQVGLQFGSTMSTTSVSTGDKIVDTSLINTIRTKIVNFSAYHMKPSTRLYAFFDNVNVDAYIATSYRLVLNKDLPNKLTTKVVSDGKDILFYKGKTLYITQSSSFLAVGNTITLDSISYTIAEISKNVNLTTDINGYVAGTFKIPSDSNISFNTGPRAFLLCDSDTNTAHRIKTSAEFIYYASGLSQTKQAQTLVTRINNVTINPVLKSQTTSVAQPPVVTVANSVNSSTTAIVNSVAPVVVSITPSNGSTGVAFASNIAVKFSSTVVLYAGTITLTKSDGTVVETFSVPSSLKVTVSGDTLTIDPTANYEPSIGYKLSITSGTVTDSAAIPYTGMNDYAFTAAAPTAIGASAPTAFQYSPPRNSTGIEIKSIPSINFDKAVNKVSTAFNVLIKTAADVLVQTIPSTALTISASGTLLSFGTTSLLLPNTKYKIIVPSSSIYDATDTTPTKFWSPPADWMYTTAAAISSATIGVDGTSVTSPSTAVFNGVRGTDSVTSPICSNNTATMNNDGLHTIEFTSLGDPGSFVSVYATVDNIYVGGTGGSTDVPYYICNNKSNTPVVQNIPPYVTSGHWGSHTDSQGNFKFTVNNVIDPVYPGPKVVYIKICTNSVSNVNWKIIGPTSLTPVAIFEANASPKNHTIPGIVGYDGWDHWEDPNDPTDLSKTRAEQGGTDPMFSRETYMDGHYVDHPVGTGYLHVPAGSHTITVTIRNVGTAPGIIQSSNSVISTDPILSPLGAIHASGWLTWTPGPNYPSFPLTMNQGESVIFTGTISWPETSYSIPWNAGNESWTGSSKVNDILGSANSKAFIDNYRKNVQEKIYVFNSHIMATEHKTITTGEAVSPRTYNNVTYTLPKTPAIVHGDPVAQTFFVNASENPDGYFLSSVDLFFSGKSDIDDVTVQIRPVVNGIPSAEDIVPLSIVSLSSAKVNISTYPNAADLTSVTKFKFSSPVYLLPGSYAIVVISSSKDYTLFTATMGKFRINNVDMRISTFPYTGNFFKSSNGATWLPSPAQSLCFVVNRCSFDSSGSVQFHSEKPFVNYNNTFNTFIPITALNNGDYIRVQTATNTDHVYQALNAGLTGTTAPTHTTGSVLNGSVTFRYISTGTRYSDLLIPFDNYFAQGENISFTKTEAKYSYKATNVSGTLDSGFTDNLLNTNYELGTRKLLDSVNANLYTKVDMKTSDSKLSPAIDVARFNNVLIENIVNGVVIAPNFVASTAISSGDFVKVLVIADKFRMYQVVKSGTTSAEPPTFEGDDTANGSTLMRYLGTTHNGDTELLPYKGMALSRYITRKVELATGFESTDIVVNLNAFTPAGTSIKVYYKAVSVDGSNSLENSPYYEMVLSTRDANYTTRFAEHKYVCDNGDNTVLPIIRHALGNSKKFNQFIIKIVMLSTDPVKVPKVSDLRAMALV